jgi:hydroxycarboxylate dehydrogenase B
MLSVIIDPAAMGSTELFEDEVETFIKWVKSARPQAGVAEVLAPGEPERARRERTACRSTRRPGSS